MLKSILVISILFGFSGALSGAASSEVLCGRLSYEVTQFHHWGAAFIITDEETKKQSVIVTEKQSWEFVAIVESHDYDENANGPNICLTHPSLEGKSNVDLVNDFVDLNEVWE